MGVTQPENLEFMTVKEVAKIFRRHEVTIYRWLEGGLVFNGAKKIRRGWLIPRHEVIRILNSGTITVH